MSGEWLPGQNSRYLGCGLHAAALDRMDYFDAFDRAALCQRDGGGCVVEVRWA